MYPKHPTVDFLIRNYSKARVIKASPADPKAVALGIQREMTDGDVVDSMVRKYAK